MPKATGGSVASKRSRMGLYFQVRLVMPHEEIEQEAPKARVSVVAHKVSGSTVRVCSKRSKSRMVGERKIEHAFF
jgi:hypothetical protein